MSSCCNVSTGLTPYLFIESPMQDQQQKQLELILAIAENGKLRKIKHGLSQENDATETRSSAEKGVKQMEISQIPASSLQKEANKEIAQEF